MQTVQRSTSFQQTARLFHAKTNSNNQEGRKSVHDELTLIRKSGFGDEERDRQPILEALEVDQEVKFNNRTKQKQYTHTKTTTPRD